MAKVDSYTFCGNAGESVTINVLSSSFTATVFVAGPNGTILANWANGSASLDLTTAGTYTVGIYSFYFGGTGPYSVSFVLTKLVPASYRLAIGATNSAAALTIWGQVGRATTLRYASDFSPTPQWLTLTNFNLPVSPFRFVDWTSTHSRQRFYQSVQYQAEPEEASARPADFRLFQLRPGLKQCSNHLLVVFPGAGFKRGIPFQSLLINGECVSETHPAIHSRSLVFNQSPFFLSKSPKRSLATERTFVLRLRRISLPPIRIRAK